MSGPRAAAGPGDSRPGAGGQKWRGERLGLPESGPGSVASLNQRALGFAIDAILAGGVAGLFTYPHLPQNWSLLSWFLITVVGVAFFGATPGHMAVGARVARVDGQRMVGLPLAVLRTALLGLVIPAVIWNADARGLHDRAARVIVLRSR